MLSVVTWKWKSPPGYRSTFGPETVNTLQRMVARHYPHPHQFLCVTDDARGLDAEVGVVPAWNDYAALPSPHGSPARYPSSYRRLRAFHPAIAEVFGPRFVSLDLDCVVTGDLTPVWHRPEDFVIWSDTQPRTLYNASMYLLSSGTRPQVWTKFDPQRSPQLAKAAGNHGSDQAWISYCLGKGQATWKRTDGVVSYRNEIVAKGLRTLPPNTRIVFFHGHYDPWHEQVQREHAWVREHYQ